MDLFVGTSGFSYKEWKGDFYPEKLPAKDMLSHYAGRLTSVEINNTFYRMPKREVLEGWTRQVPDHFRFAVKASRRITHVKRLADAGDECGYLFGNLEAMGNRLGIVLFQTPPFLKKDTERLRGFLEGLPPGIPAAFEFRHASWFEGDEATAVLREHGYAYCVTDTGDDTQAPVVPTASYGYLRLRGAAYSDADLSRWMDRIRETGWDRAFVFFKHEDDCAGPQLAERFAALATKESA